MNENHSFNCLDFERPVIALENQIKELKEVALENIDLGSEIKLLENKVQGLIESTYSSLAEWDRVQLSRHPCRPHTTNYIESIFGNFHELHGDRGFSDDRAIVGGIGHLNDRPVMVIGIEKGRKTKEKIVHNFGMPRPEGYRKALRLMRMASRFKIPIITFIDTPGAYPGIDAEERGQSQAIAENLEEMFKLDVPLIALVIGEGGSGGALALGISDIVLMQEYSIYSVISPESCASILWADPKRANDAAAALKLTSQKALDLKVVDGIIKEPPGGAHRDPELAAKLIKFELLSRLSSLEKLDRAKLKELRFQKFREMGKSTLI